MAYADEPHIEARFDPVGTGTPYKIDWVNNVAGVMVAAGWEPEVVLEANSTSGENYYRTVAPVVLEIVQSGEFDSFGFFSSPPSDSCDGLAVWSIHTSGGQLNVGWDNAPGQYTEVMNCCVCAGACSAGATWGTDSGTNTCTRSCVDGGAGLCIVADTWTWPSGDQAGQHSALIERIVKYTGGCAQKDYELLSQVTSGTQITSLIAIWCEGGSTNPLVGVSELTVPGIGAAFNSTVRRRHGGWVLHSQPSNTTENTTTIYLGVDRFSEGGGDTVASTFPFMYTFSTYTAQTHPVLYIEGTAPLSGAATRMFLRNELNDMRMIANQYHSHMYSDRGGTAVATGSSNYWNVGVLRTVPVNGEEPAAPSNWSFRKAAFHVGCGAGGDITKGLQMRNFPDTDINNWYMLIDTSAGTQTRTTGADNEQLAVGGFAWGDRVKAGEPDVVWRSDEAFLCEPWVGFNASTATTGVTLSPILGQLWDCIVPSTVGGSGYFFWDDQWWRHWQNLRTDKTTTGGPPANISWRVGFQALDGEEPVSGTWAWPVEPRDVFLYNLQSAGVLEPFPWGDLTAVTISTDTFSGGTTTATLTATATQNTDAQDDGEKLVAVHSRAGYLSFAPAIISIGSGSTTGTSVVTALSPGLSGVSATIQANSINAKSVDVQVED